MAAGKCGEQGTAAVLRRFPESLRTAYQDQWQPAYAQLALWSTRADPASI